MPAPQDFATGRPKLLQTRSPSGGPGPGPVCFGVSPVYAQRPGL